MNNNNFIVGVDIGAVTTKVVIINQSKEIISYHLIHTGTNVESTVEKALDLAVKKADISKEKIISLGATGRGRNSIRSNNSVSEITALGKGAFYLNNRIKNMLDIGGYGTRAINIENNGNILKFLVSDKCASSTGSFLENMASIFQLSLKEWIDKGLSSQSPVEINTTCAIFAESEVITKLAQHIQEEDIIAGIHLAIIKRLTPIIKSLGVADELMLTGGVSLNQLFIKILQNYLGIKPIVASKPQIIGALGAAILTLENLESC